MTNEEKARELCDLIFSACKDDISKKTIEKKIIMSKKKIQRPYSIEAWKKGAQVETRDGRKVRILCTDAKIIYGDTPQPILGLVTKDDEEVSESWTIDGSYSTIREKSINDLVIVEEVEESDVSKTIVAKLNEPENFNVFATEKQAKSALAMARISQLMANNKRYGGVVTDAEWNDSNIPKYCIERDSNVVDIDAYFERYHFLAFHSAEQRDLFLAENERLVKDFLMID